MGAPSLALLGCAVFALLACFMPTLAVRTTYEQHFPAKAHSFITAFDPAWLEAEKCIFRPYTNELLEDVLKTHSLILFDTYSQFNVVSCFPPGAETSEKKRHAFRTVLADPRVRDYFPVTLPTRLTPCALPSDPSFAEQWYLRVEDSSLEELGLVVSGADVSVEPAWDRGLTGAGQVVVAVDTGIQWDHPDLTAGYLPALSYNYNDNDAYEVPTDPTPTSVTMNHGTTAVSLIAATWNNENCITGVAPGASWAGRFFVFANTESVDDALVHALTADAASARVFANGWNFQACALYMCHYELDYTLFSDAIADGVASGNAGLGATYIFPTGNNGDLNAHTNLGIECRDPNVICVGAMTSDAVAANYSTSGTGMFVVAPSGGTTTIWNENVAIEAALNNGRCGAVKKGTSYASSLVAGIVLLMFEANTQLTHRDVKHILRQAAVPIDNCQDTQSCYKDGWVTNGAGVSHSTFYGFGLVNADNATRIAAAWGAATSAATRVQSDVFISINGDAVDYNNEYDFYGWSIGFPVTNKFLVLEDVLIAIEWAGFNNPDDTGTDELPSAGNVAIELISPSGTRSRFTKVVNISKYYVIEDEPAAYIGPVYMRSLQFWGEESDGDWEALVWYDSSEVKTEQFLYQVSVAFVGIEMAAVVDTKTPSKIVVLSRDVDITVCWVENKQFEGYDEDQPVGFVVFSDGALVEVGRAIMSDHCTAVRLPEATELDTDMCCFYVNDPQYCAELAPQSHAYFFRFSVTDLPITIVDPSAGDTFYVGRDMLITWVTSDAFSENVIVTIGSEAGDVAHTIGEFDSSQQSVRYTIPEDLAGPCTVAVASDSLGVVDSVSIIVESVIGFLNSVQTAGDVLTFDAQTVTYNASKEIDALSFILASEDNEEISVAENEPCTGSFSFIIPNVTEGLYRVIVESSQSLLHAASPFFEVVYQPIISVSSPTKEHLFLNQAVTLQIEKSDSAMGFATVSVERMDTFNSSVDLFITSALEVNVSTNDVPFDVFRLAVTPNHIEDCTAHTGTFTLTPLSIVEIIFIVVGVVVVATLLALLVIAIVIRRRRARPMAKALTAPALSDSYSTSMVISPVHAPRVRRLDACIDSEELLMTDAEAPA
eukprot:gnl/Chilomastix_cuspidata/3538.p1 GENE.gnl/Chilomastix_cuspidata/3538~~gnl/Chilomastix_cuspidata/3538.p1  ORF type:complete len:1113 (+),score=213.93 gnl/Chilomastix_cuspidata/3538:588-3926(+)